LIIKSGTQLIKYYLDIDRDEQAQRLKSRETDPLKQWKISPIDQQAQKKWKDYSLARNAMLKKTSSALAPWTVINANDKKLTHLNLIRDLLSRTNYPNKDKKLLSLDSKVVMPCPPLGKKAPSLAP
jgi:polyphosphate kinase 2 (PPK2 family)